VQDLSRTAKKSHFAAHYPPFYSPFFYKNDQLLTNNDSATYHNTLLLKELRVIEARNKLVLMGLRDWGGRQTPQSCACQRAGASVNWGVANVGEVE
jgi:hypothetical protein